MLKVKGQVCDVCGEPFVNDSDIVVCPDCGTPHHRRCWHQLGHCVNRDKHNTDFEWKPVAENIPQIENGITCPDCGAMMPQGTMYCENCGRQLPAAPGTQTYNAPGNTMENNRFPVAGSMSFEEYKAQVDRELAGDIDGVPLRDIAVFVGTNAKYYIYHFKKMQQNKKHKPFVLSACLFPPLWLLFRKLWKHAILAALINSILNIPTFILMAVQTGALSASSPLVFPGIEAVARITSILVLVVGIAWGLLAVPLYKKDTVRRLKKMKEESMGDTNTYYRSILENAGPSKIGMFVVVVFAALYMMALFGI